ncbi:MAG: hypothetical protein HYY29_05625 [Chloroflexi bacterium]|nr:hypothetical protein [Chloroflexota bacterium]MBI4329995.1 hypothetical protein [Chloroflexota bacterium]
MEPTRTAAFDPGRAVYPETARMTVEELKKKLDRKEPVFIIDTRSSITWRESEVKLPGAVRFHYQDLEENIDAVPRGRPIVIYCT